MQNAETAYAPARVAVVGGGAAGLLAAGSALHAGADVTVFEQNSRCGRKLLLTGKGRCNVTNDCAPDEFLSSVVRNPRFLYTALAAFAPADTMALLEGVGVPLKVERGRRVFPVSDHAADILEGLLRYAEGAHFQYSRVRRLLLRDGRCTGVVTDGGDFPFDAVILATGGRSYPKTGSDGSGYALARAAGHTVTPLCPSLVPIESPSPLCGEMQGLSLRNVGFRILREDGSCVYDDFGELLFTHFGISGPVVLSASAHLRDEEFSRLRAVIDLKPALDEKTLDARLLRDFAEFANRDLHNALHALLPAKMIPPFIALTGLRADTKVHTITREQRHTLLTQLKQFTLPLSGFRPLEEAIVTAGGVEVKEVSPKTMESRRTAGLYFAGEILDLDAYTGGFNLQIAFSTGFLAGRAAALAGQK